MAFEQLYCLGGHTDEVNVVAMSASGEKVVTVGDDGMLFVWNSTSGEKLNSFQAAPNPVHHADVFSDGERVVTGSIDCSAYIWDLSSGEKLHTIDGHRVAVFPDGRKVMSASSDERTSIWDASSGQLLHTLGPPGEVQTFDVFPDCCRVIIAVAHTAAIWDADSGEKIHTLEGHVDVVAILKVFPHGDRVITGSDDGRAMVWDADSGQRVHVLEGHHAPLGALDVFPDGSKVATGGDDCKIRVWCADTGQQLHELSGHAGSINDLLAFPDGSRVVSASDDGMAIVWDAFSGEMFQQLVHTQTLYTVVVLPDCKKLVTAGTETTAKIWGIVHIMPLVLSAALGADAGLIVMCANLAGICLAVLEAGTQDSYETLHALIQERLPPPPDARWQPLLSTGMTILAEGDSDTTLGQLFGPEVLQG